MLVAFELCFLAGFHFASIGETQARISAFWLNVSRKVNMSALQILLSYMLKSISVHCINYNCLIFSSRLCKCETQSQIIVSWLLHVCCYMYSSILLFNELSDMTVRFIFAKMNLVANFANGITWCVDAILLQLLGSHN